MSRRLCTSVALAVSALSSIHAQSTAPVILPADNLNLGFEREDTVLVGRPADWYAGGAGYDVRLDTVAPRAGVRSLRIRSLGYASSQAFGVATQSVSARPAIGRSIRLRGSIRTEGITTGYAGLWLRVDGRDSMLALENMNKQGLRGTTPWSEYEIVLPVDRTATRIAFGVLHPGDGTAWFDSLSLSVDGRTWEEVAPPWRPSAREQAWVRRNAIPLTTTDAGAPTSDLAALRPAFEGASIVALGEGTHGTSEFFRMKHRLTEYLAREHGFTVFAIEDNMPEARRVNDYVLTGRGDPAALVRGLMNWPWKTEEVLDLVRWMREYNASGKGRIEFWGFDLQRPDEAMDSVRAFVARADTSSLAMVDSNYAAVREVVRQRRTGPTSTDMLDAWRSAAGRVLGHLQSRASTYTTTRDTMEIAWAVQYARIVAQGATVSSREAGERRDRSMAENVRWMLQHHPAGTKAVLWAHNGHVSRSRAMGGDLDTMYRGALRTVGFATGEGTYTVWSGGGFGSYPLSPPSSGSVEATMRASGIPRFALDLRVVTRSPDSAWLGEPHDFRAIGAMLIGRQFFETAVARDFDLLVYLDRTSASRLLPTVDR